LNKAYVSADPGSQLVIYPAFARRGCLL